MNRPLMPRAKGDGLEMQLAKWSGTGPTTLCIHGLSANCRWWDVVAKTWSPPHRLLAMDLRGRGLSDKPATGYSLDHHCRDIDAVLNDLSPDRVILMGHSLGAFIASAFTAQFPDRVERLILVDGGGQLTPEQSAKVLDGVRPSVERLGKVFPTFEASIDYLKQALPVKPWLEALVMSKSLSDSPEN